MRTDFESLRNGDVVFLYPNSNNPLHRKPVMAVYSSGYFYCAGSSSIDGPDYYLGDVLKFNNGFTLRESAEDEAGDEF